LAFLLETPLADLGGTLCGMGDQNGNREKGRIHIRIIAKQ